MKKETLGFRYAKAIVVRGKKAQTEKHNPYRKGTTKWYCWRTGFRNKEHAAATVVELLRALNYPIGD